MKDVNDTGFKLVLGRSDWKNRFGVSVSKTASEGPGVVYDPKSRSATLRSRTKRFPHPSGEAALTTSDRTSAARDRYGSWYWIDPDSRQRIVVRSAGDDRVSTFWPGEAKASGDVANGRFRPVEEEERTEPPRLGGLTITTDHRLVVGAQSPDQLLVFDLHAGGPPHRIPWLGGTSFAPIDATPRPDGGLYILEQPNETGARLWPLDHTFTPAFPAGPEKRSSSFRPVRGKEDEHERTASLPAWAAPTLPSALRPETIQVLPDDTVLVLSSTDLEGRDTAIVVRYRFSANGEVEGPLGTVSLSEIIAPGADATGDGDWDEWRAHDLAFLPETAGLTEAFHGTLYVVGRDGKQVYSLDLTGEADGITAERMATYIPLRRFAGKGLVEADGTVYYDLRDRWLPIRARHRPRFVDRGQIESSPFDSEIVGCTWHRLFVDACIPAEATVRVESRASDDADGLRDQPWQPEPALYRRDDGAEIPYEGDAPPNSEADDWGTWELLLQHAEGRFVEVRLTLEGDGRTAPRLHALRLYAPRFSYLDEYMPDLYREDEVSARFVEHFLANPEGLLTTIEGKIAKVKALFDVRTVPDEYLDWLATWFGTHFDPALDTRRKRLFLDHAVELFNQRGTLGGLARMLKLVLDPCVDESLFTAAGIAGAVGRPEDADEHTVRRGGIRLIEQFAARDVPRAVVGDARSLEQPMKVRVDQPWTPGDGAATLHQRFRTFLGRQRPGSSQKRGSAWGDRPSFPPLLPSTEAENGTKKRNDWRLFVRRVIEGPYAAIEAETVQRKGGDAADSVTRRFRAFLERRYNTIQRVPASLREGAASFRTVQLPKEVPDGSSLRDWMHFMGTAVPIHRAAHRFRVLVPVDPDAEIAKQRRRLDVARRVVETQKPAHTAFDVLPYWAAFRVGGVRTGLDTVLGSGSRYSSLLVGEGALAEETVGAAHPENVPDRRVTGRDPADAIRPL